MREKLKDHIRAVVEGIKHLTITFGWWAIPALITMLSLGLALKMGFSNTSIGGTVSIGIMIMQACLVSLTAWLIWAVLT